MTWRASVLRTLSAFGLVSQLSLPSTLQAGINVSLAGSLESSSNSLEKHRDNSVSANLSTNLGSHILLGITHRRSFENKTGYKRANSDQENVYVYIPFKDYGESVTNSLDLTIIPYNGLVSPFIFGGVARRDYRNTMIFLGNVSQSKQSMFPIPNYGFGTVISLGAGFQLKITQTFSPGIQTVLEEGQEISSVVNDTYTQIGIGYKL